MFSTSIIPIALCENFNYISKVEGEILTLGNLQLNVAL